MVARMKAAGCVVIGKTNVPEFGLGSHTFNEVFGITRNPFDLTRSAGGSSGGAAVCLATHMLPVADGSDYMGSLRNPAAWNDVFGFRPSQGRVPGGPERDSFLAQLATEGPMGRTVLDVALLLGTQAGYDAGSPLSLSGRLDDFATVERARVALQSDPAGVRVGWLGDLDGYLATEAGIIECCEAGLHRMETIGCRVEPAAFDMAPERVWDAWLVWRHFLVSANLQGASHRSREPRPDETGSPVGGRSGDAHHWTADELMHRPSALPSTRASLRCSSASMCSRSPRRRCGRSRRPSDGLAGSAIVKWTRTTGGWRSSCMPPLPAFLPSACQSGSMPTGCRWACN